MIGFKRLIKQKKSLLAKILTAISLFILLNLILYLVPSKSINYYYNNLLKNSVDQEQIMADNFLKYPENIINILVREKSLPEYKGKNSKLKEEIISLFESIIISDSRISNIYYVSNSSDFVAYKNKKEVGAEIIQTSWFQNAVKEGTQTIWVSHKSEFTGEDVLSCLQLVLDKSGSAKGVVGLDIVGYKLNGLVNNVKFGENGCLIILDGNKILVQPDSNYIGEVFDDRIAKEYKYKSLDYNKFNWKIVALVPVYEVNKKIRAPLLWGNVFYLVSFIAIVAIYIKIKSIEIRELNQTLEKKVLERTDEVNKLYRELIVVNEDINIKNQELMDANEKLKEHAEIVEELAMSKERNRLARDVHDTIGHTLTLLITLLQVSILSLSKDDKQETKDTLETAIKAAREGLNEVRRSISGFKPGKLDENNLFLELERLADNFKSAGISVELSVSKLVETLNKDYSETVFRICQEAITNSLRHGKATEVTIIVKFRDGYINLFIIDNGIGCKTTNHKVGFGLEGMKQRVKKLNGSIEFGSNDEGGFNIHAELPIVS
ncbi:sensor histidine kinase [Acetivibrio cellulolyticus]|uniref:sensor histidine kinase n=1 Tax=Acetivibrio cellulolyticus TaxID=35830 RepID=UPI0001E2F5EE|nr:histidine kinase [Acetivibrio cellulolyticus]